MQMPAAVETGGGSEGQSESHLAVSESAPLWAAVSSWVDSSCESWRQGMLPSKPACESLTTRPLGPVAHAMSPVEKPWLRSRSAKWAMKITQRAIVKRRSCGSIYQSDCPQPPSVCLTNH